MSTPKQEGFETGVENFYALSFEGKQSYWLSRGAVDWLNALSSDDDDALDVSPYLDVDDDKADEWNEGWWEGLDHGLTQWRDEEGT